MAKQTKGYRRKRKTSRPDNTSIPESANNSCESRIPGGNHPEWYIYDKTMFEGVIQMPTLEFKGKNVPWKTSSVISMTATNSIKAPVASIYYMNPSAGPGHAEFNSTDLYNNPINVAARKMYAELSASNAKTSQYAPQDIATLILALGQVIAMVTNAKRLYKIANYFNFYNRVIPKVLVEACNVSYDGTLGLKSNMSDFRAKLNQIIARVNTIKFPGNLNYFKKCGYIYDNVFVDRLDEMPTFQMMVPYSTWTLDEAGSTAGSVLKTTVINSTTSEGAIQYLNRIETMIEAILTSSTFNFIFADVINLANRGVLSNPSVTLDLVSIDETISPQYDQRFNWQVRNLTMVGVPNGTGPTESETPLNDVYPDADQSAIFYSPSFGKQSDSNTALNRYALNNPVRLPDVSISHEDFVSLLAYYNAATAMSFEGSKYGGIIPSITDYYCVKQSVYTGTGNIAINIQGHGLTTTDQYSALTIENAPTYFAGTASNGTALVLSDLGAYTQLDVNALENLRFQTFLGLFKFE